MIKICIVGDTFPGDSIQEQFIKGDSRSIVGDKIYERIQAADYCVANLETPLTRHTNGIVKNGPILFADPEVAIGLAALGVNLVTLANNHILDCGTQGLTDTYKALESNSIAHFGTGNNLSDLKKSYIVEQKSIKIGFYACSENEFSIAGDNTPGANPFNLHQNCLDVSQLKKSCDRVAVLLHGGKEYYRYPSIELQHSCHALVDSGADLVLCQHSHCVGSVEKCGDATIVYGQGNFVFPGSDDEYWNNGLLLEWEINEETHSVQLVPFCSENGVIHEAEGDVKASLIDSLNSRSQEIQNPDFIKKNYNKFAKDFLSTYISNIFGYSKWERRWDRYVFKGRLFKKKLNRARALALLNFVECEAHRELLCNGLKQYIENEE